MPSDGNPNASPSARPVTILGAHRAEVGESVCWSAREGVLFSVDVWGRLVCRTSLDGDQRLYDTPEMAAAVLAARDGLIVAMETSLVRLDPRTGAMQTLSAPDDHPASHRFNDATTDPAGRLIIGTMRKSQLGAAPTGALYCLDQNGWRLLLDGLWTVNGLAFSPDGRTLYVSDSHPSTRTVWRFDYDLAQGTLGEREIFVDMHGLAGRPDGAAIDAQGGYWIAGVGGSAVYHFGPDGALIDTVPMPVENPTKVAFGGVNLDRLFVTSMSVNLTRPDSRGVAGALMELKPGVRGLAMAEAIL